MKKFYQTATASLLLSLCLASCNNDSDYPAGYVGFEHSSQEYPYNKSTQEEILEIKIIAVDKEKKDRTVKLSANSIEIPGEPSCYQLTEKQVTIKADQKSVTTRIKIFPQYILKNATLRLTCTPQWKDNDPKQSRLIIQFTPK